MLRPGAPWKWLTFLAAVGLTWLVRATPGKENLAVIPSQENKAAVSIAATLQRLNQRTSLERGVDPNTPLRDVLDFLQERCELPAIYVDVWAFRSPEVGIEAIEDQPVRLPRMLNVRLSTVLRLVLAQVQGTYIVRRDYIEITPLRTSRPQRFEEGQPLPELQYLPSIHAAFVNRRLPSALDELSDLSDYSVVLDSRTHEKASSTLVTTTLTNVPLDTAVQVLADLADLSAVRLDNMLYVTTKENAARWKAELEKAKPPRPEPTTGKKAPPQGPSKGETPPS
jgi:hypothetical protein